jgi:hypothetical protein
VLSKVRLQAHKLIQIHSNTGNFLLAFCTWILTHEIYTGYGDMAEMGKSGPSQGKVTSQGNAYINAQFPKLDKLAKCARSKSPPSDADVNAVALGADDYHAPEPAEKAKEPERSKVVLTNKSKRKMQVSGCVLYGMRLARDELLHSMAFPHTVLHFPLSTVLLPALITANRSRSSNV